MTWIWWKEMFISWAWSAVFLVYWVSVFWGQNIHSFGPFICHVTFSERSTSNMDSSYNTIFLHTLVESVLFWFRIQPTLRSFSKLRRRKPKRPTVPPNLLDIFPCTKLSVTSVGVDSSLSQSECLIQHTPPKLVRAPTGKKENYNIASCEKSKLRGPYRVLGNLEALIGFCKLKKHTFQYHFFFFTFFLIFIIMEYIMGGQ